MCLIATQILLTLFIPSTYQPWVFAFGGAFLFISAILSLHYIGFYHSETDIENNSSDINI